MADRAEVVAGIFVGGESTRMGGVAKGLLPSPDGPHIVDRWRASFEALRIPCVLVGRRDEYADVPLETLRDAPAGIGPLGGVVALLGYARGRYRHAITVGCDMPRVSVGLIERLVAAPDAIAVAPRAVADGRWEAMFARYDVDAAYETAATRASEASPSAPRSLHGLLDALHCVPLGLDASEETLLVDWDTPADRAR